MSGGLVIPYILLLLSPIIYSAPVDAKFPEKNGKTLDIVHSSFGEALNDLFRKLEIQDDGPYQVTVKADPKPPIFPYHYQGYPFDYKFRKTDRLRGHHNGYPPEGPHPYGSHERFYCPNNGLYYRDETSFYSCASGQYNVLHCAPGTRNRPREDYLKVKYTKSEEEIKVDFCSVNLVALVPNHPRLHSDYPYY